MWTQALWGAPSGGPALWWVGSVGLGECVCICWGDVAGGLLQVWHWDGIFLLARLPPGVLSVIFTFVFSSPVSNILSLCLYLSYFLILLLHSFSYVLFCSCTVLPLYCLLPSTLSLSLSASHFPGTGVCTVFKMPMFGALSYGERRLINKVPYPYPYVKHNTWYLSNRAWVGVHYHGIMAPLWFGRRYEAAGRVP